MRAICFIQEVKNGNLTMRQQILICRKALRKLRWPCVQELYAALALRTGVVRSGRNRRTTADAAPWGNGFTSRSCKR